MMEQYLPYIELGNFFIVYCMLAWVTTRQNNCLWKPTFRWQRMLIVAVAFMLAYLSFAGAVYSIGSSIEQITATTISGLLVITAIIVLTVIDYRALLLFIGLIDVKTLKIKPWKWLEKRHEMTMVFMWLTIARLPYLAIYYPGNIDSDCGGSIGAFYKAFTEYSQILGYHSLGNHIPVIHTLLYGGATYVGGLIGSQNLGIFFLILLQLLLINWTISMCVKNLYEMECDVRIVNLMVAVYALLPIYSLWSIELAKDQLYACVLLLYILQLWKTVRTNGECMKEWRTFLIHATVIFCVCIMKNQGVYIVVLCGMLLAFFYKKNYLRTLTVYILGVGVYLWIWKGLLFGLLHISPVGKQEAMGFMYQQTARVAVMHPDAFTNEDMETIDKIIPFSILKARYNPVLQDDVKFCSREFGGALVHESDYDSYKDVWRKMAFQHPLCYFEALNNCCYGFFFPFKIYSRMFHHSKKPLGICTAHPDIFTYHQMDGTYALQRGIKYLLPILSAIPVAGLLMGFPIHTWILQFSVLLLLLIGKWKECVIWLPVLLSLAVIWVSPANDVYRYIEPVVFAAPVAFVYALSQFKMNKKLS